MKKIVPKEMVETLNQIRAAWDRKKAVKERKNANKDKKSKDYEREEIRRRRRKSILNMDKDIIQK